MTQCGAGMNAGGITTNRSREMYGSIPLDLVRFASYLNVNSVL
jgi:hypothetical protein